MDLFEGQLSYNEIVGMEIRKLHGLLRAKEKHVQKKIEDQKRREDEEERRTAKAARSY